jgi:ABC-type oligopeptide transport system substrate-binding subunit
MATATKSSTSGTSSDASASGTDPTPIDTTNIPEVVADEEARLTAVRGVNPNTGATAGLVETVAEDPNLSALALALRTSAPGSFQPLAADLRSVEASINAAIALNTGLNLAGIKVEVMSTDEYEKFMNPTPPEEPAADTVSTETSSGRTTSSSSSSSTPTP